MSENTTTYTTKQGRLVLDCFENNKGVHLTIDDICSYLKEQNTPVGTTTVYRQVQKLLDEGIITKYNVDKESGACYQYSGENCKMHFHLNKYYLNLELLNKIFYLNWYIHNIVFHRWM